mmetsp:Transcript_26156/g.104635  ORF Transcript_26156/g.104635 Transcript_26156/m.104635 type:complete len:215 (+) Transcript_26156:672-1316(+)
MLRSPKRRTFSTAAPSTSRRRTWRGVAAKPWCQPPPSRRPSSARAPWPRRRAKTRCSDRCPSASRRKRPTRSRIIDETRTSGAADARYLRSSTNISTAGAASVAATRPSRVRRSGRASRTMGRRRPTPATRSPSSWITCSTGPRSSTNTRRRCKPTRGRRAPRSAKSCRSRFRCSRSRPRSPSSSNFSRPRTPPPRRRTSPVARTTVGSSSSAA